LLVAYQLRGEGYSVGYSVADCGGGMFVYCNASLIVRYRNPWAVDGRVMRRAIISSMPVSCQFPDCKSASLVMSLTHVSSGAASTRPLPLPLPADFSSAVRTYITCMGLLYLHRAQFVQGVRGGELC